MNLAFSFLFFIILSCFGSNEAKCHKNTVAFRNSLSQSHSVLKVHCWSKDDDLGDHFLNFEGPTYNFSFHDSVFTGTSFTCNLYKGAYQRTIVAYLGAAIYRCGALYTWVARDDAIYLSKNGKPETLEYQWIKS
ncbi:hypothetical protein CARUB_v10015720mg [Capsella rubella]|uniref:S-protein homolog n=1 Tax=Capsella rubella TaxID=81985 RepID=R0HRN4_9BRAS|nr:hypothetical protein CARUB_v10015720mg [Capsella rubella]